MTDDDADQAASAEPAEHDERRAALKSWKLWLAPVIAVVIAMGAMAGLYLSSILDPVKNLSSFPIAVVNEDQGAAGPTGEQNLGDTMQTTVEQKVDRDKVSLENLSWADAQEKMRDGDVYGTIRVPADFSAKTMALAEGAMTPTPVERPQVIVYTNPRSGTLGSSLVTALSKEALAEMNRQIGDQLTAAVAEQTAAMTPRPAVSGAAATVLASPVDIVSTTFDPLPAGTGMGLSAFYFALLVLLAGFTGAMLINSLVDSSLGYIASEIGPRVIVRKSLDLTRTSVLLIKWAIMVAASLVVSGAYIGIAAALDMPIDHGWALWAYSALAASAVGITAMAVISAFGTIGLLINMFVFIFLGLPSAGATTPIQAAPGFFAWLASFEPLHQVYEAIRAILYFDARGSAGLTHGLVMTVIGLAIGVVLGLGVNWYYDHKGLSRATVSELTQPQLSRRNVNPS
ncbi:YhgE/Pip domain-containing protein [Gordonia liuliyuniae]|uniref:SNG1 family protein n=1 Tax=Gordonia liuliyuniae TaxID=2911517 RepID=A0ABS9IS21_9ACTN|nr:DUF3533 domain-containing protein [Gordonia liuliyuniae]MCF8588348.1 SNG1 family protein [Gordonia liuliyuniae]